MRDLASSQEEFIEKYCELLVIDCLHFPEIDELILLCILLVEIQIIGKAGRL